MAERDWITPVVAVGGLGVAIWGAWSLLHKETAASDSVKITSISFNEERTLVKALDVITADVTWTNEGNAEITPAFQVVLKKTTEPWDTIIGEEVVVESPSVPVGKQDSISVSSRGVPDDWVPGTIFYAYFRVEKENGSWKSLKTSQAFTVQEPGDEYSVHKDYVTYNNNILSVNSNTQFPVKVVFTNQGTAATRWKFRVVFPLGLGLYLLGEWVTSDIINPQQPATLNLTSPTVPTIWSNGYVFHPYVQMDGLDGKFDDGVAMTVYKPEVSFSFGQAVASPDPVVAGQNVAITYPVTSHCTATVTVTAVIKIYDGGGQLYLHGRLLAEITKQIKINPEQSLDVVVNYTATVSEHQDRDVGIEILYEGASVDSDEDDGVFTVTDAYNPAISISPTSIVSSGYITLNYSGFRPGYPLTIYIDQWLTAYTTIPNPVTGSATIRIIGTPGNHTLIVTDGLIPVTAAFIIEEPTQLNPTLTVLNSPITQGGYVSFWFQDFLPNMQVHVYIVGGEGLYFTSNSSGSGTGTIQTVQVPGTHTLYATDGIVYATATFEISANLSGPNFPAPGIIGDGNLWYWIIFNDNSAAWYVEEVAIDIMNDPYSDVKTYYGPYASGATA